MPKHWEPNYKGPLPGNQLEFLTPFAKKGMETDTTPESRVVAYCNEAIGNILGWPLAPARIGEFLKDVTTPNEAALNKGRLYSQRASKGANQYKFLLVPESKIPVVYYNPITFAKSSSEFTRKSFSISFDRAISVTEVKLWARGVDLIIPDFVKKIYAVITPSLKVHPIRSRADNTKEIYISNEMKAAVVKLGIKVIAPGG